MVEATVFSLNRIGTQSKLRQRRQYLAWGNKDKREVGANNEEVKLINNKGFKIIRHHLLICTKILYAHYVCLLSVCFDIFFAHEFPEIFKKLGYFLLTAHGMTYQLVLILLTQTIS